MIRPWTEADAAACLAIYEPFVTDSIVTFESEVPGVEEFRGRLSSYATTHPVLVTQDAGAVVGYAYATQIRWKPAYQWTVESTIYMAPEARGTGKARRLYEVLLDLLRRQGARHVFGIVSLPNDRSVAFHESLGFKHEVTFPAMGNKYGRWIDCWWSRLEFDVGDDPAPFDSDWPTLFEAATRG